MRKHLIFLRLIVLFVFFIVKPEHSTYANPNCSISSFSMTPSGRVQLGTHVFLEGHSDCGTVKFTVNGISKAEIGQGNQTETLKTEEFGIGTLEVCFLARGDGGWENANKSCKTLYVQDSQESSKSAHEEETSNNSTPKTSNNSNNSNPGTNNSCQGHYVTFNVGDYGKVTPGPANNLRSCAGLSCQKLGEIPGNAEFKVLDGPICTDGYWWWKVEHDGKTGWTVEGSKGSAWLEKSNQKYSNIEKDILVVVYSDYWHENYSFLINPRTCAITNGASIISQEISNFDQSIGQLATDKQRLKDMYQYFRVNNGELEIFRKKLEKTISEETDCNNTYYRVGKVSMDTSGLGNVAYGYAMQKMPYLFDEGVADIAQALNSDSLGWAWDNPDDRKQRELGRNLTKISIISPEIIEDKAENIDLF